MTIQQFLAQQLAEHVERGLYPPEGYRVEGSVGADGKFVFEVVAKEFMQAFGAPLAHAEVEVSLTEDFWPLRRKVEALLSKELSKCGK